MSSSPNLICILSSYHVQRRHVTKRVYRLAVRVPHESIIFPRMNDNNTGIRTWSKSLRLQYISPSGIVTCFVGTSVKIWLTADNLVANKERNKIVLVVQDDAYKDINLIWIDMTAGERKSWSNVYDCGRLFHWGFCFDSTTENPLTYERKGSNIKMRKWFHEMILNMVGIYHIK